ncbi:MAG: amidohydrolase [Gemmatimonadetes bacterium]|nr:amidohydrolase [Gemmatimonadota bacterium]
MCRTDRRCVVLPRLVVLAVLSAGCLPALRAQSRSATLAAEIDRRAAAALPRVVAWRRDIHQHPELSFAEVRTAKLVADQLTALGLEVRTGVARTGVVGVLRGARSGPVVALRAGMDGLPVTELVDLPFKSTVRTQYNGQEVGVMHACGHDNHVAILLGTAEVLAGMRERLPGTVKFIFQPAEESVSGAQLMITEGVLEDPAPQAIFGLHVWPAPLGTIGYRAGPFMAASDGLNIVVRGRQTHGALPWGGVDPIVVASQIVLALQTIPSRQLDVTRAPAIVTVGMIRGGTRGNIIPDSVILEGTLRTFDEGMRADVKQRIRRTVEQIAQSAGATAVVDFGTANAPVTINDSALTEQVLPTLRRVAGSDKVLLAGLSMPSEDCAYYQQRVPGVFFFLGVAPDGQDPRTVAPNHSPYFFADEGALPVGVRALASLAVDYLTSAVPGR